LSKTSPKSNKKQNSSTNKRHKPNRNSQQEDKALEESLVQQAWQKQRESEQLNVNHEEILEEEEKRTSPICIEE
jgi:hypothetical protein